jgi:hypothetical protein
MRLLLIASALAISACAMAPSERAAAVRDADEHMVEACRYVGEVQGASGWGGPGGTSAGATNSRNEARDQAAALGATHVVWNPASSTQTGATMVSGRAYRCG